MLRNATTDAKVFRTVLTGNDIFVLVRVAAGDRPWTFRSLGVELGIDPAALHRSVARLKHAKLLNEQREANRSSVEEFLIHGLRYLLPAEPGPLGRGIPTAWGAAPLRGLLAAGDEAPPVWPDVNGKVRGHVVEPISDGVPELVASRPDLAEWFFLMDGIRLGRARERQLAAQELRSRIWGSSRPPS